LADSLLKFGVNVISLNPGSLSIATATATVARVGEVTVVVRTSEEARFPQPTVAEWIRCRS